MGKKKVLQILAGAKEYNGVSDFLLSYYSHMDREKVQFDFLFCRENTMTSKMNEPFLIGSEFIELKSRLTGKLKDSLRLISSIQKEIERGNYDIVHINTGSILITACGVIAASRAKTRTIISHSHNTNPIDTRVRSKTKQFFVSHINNLLRKIIIKKSTLLFACSQEAGDYLFGRRGISLEQFKIIPNAIQTEKFLFNPNLRNKIRREYLVENSTTVLGCVGRFSKQKNHPFLIRVFKQYQLINGDSVLWLIGEGEEKQKIESLVNQMGLSDKVRFFGQRNDVNELLQAFDGFVLTSFFEGLGIVAIEAQAACLDVFIPDEVSHGSDISDLIHFIPLSAGEAAWAEEIDNKLDKERRRYDMSSIIAENGYDIKEAARLLERIYMKN